MKKVINRIPGTHENQIPNMITITIRLQNIALLQKYGCLDAEGMVRFLWLTFLFFIGKYLEGIKFLG